MSPFTAILIMAGFVLSLSIASMYGPVVFVLTMFSYPAFINYIGRLQEDGDA